MNNLSSKLVVHYLTSDTINNLNTYFNIHIFMTEIRSIWLFDVIIVCLLQYDKYIYTVA